MDLITRHEPILDRFMKAFTIFRENSGRESGLFCKESQLATSSLPDRCLIPIFSVAKSFRWWVSPFPEHFVPKVSDMSEQKFSRRNFSVLTGAALGGLAAGAAGQASAQQAAKKELSVDPALLASEPHACRGLNTCNGKGHGGDNACGGQGACASVAKHECKGVNDCKGQGGCGGYPAQNTCKGKGHCAVPLMKDASKLARKQFEQIMADMGQKVGSPPKAS